MRIDRLISLVAGLARVRATLDSPEVLRLRLPGNATVICHTTLVAVLLIGITSGVLLASDQELEKQATWQQPSTPAVKALLDQWLATRQTDEATLTAIHDLWNEDPTAPGAPDILRQLATSIALVDASARPLVDLCNQDTAAYLLPDFEFLLTADLAPLVRNNLRLFYGCWLAQRLFYDESLAQIADLQPADVVDPTSLLFYQGICHHRLLNKEPCLAAVRRLLENKGAIPKRYETLAMLMEADMSPLKTDSLDEIARLMDDVERRLDLGRAGKRVRKEEDDVIAKLDKMIEEIEKQQKQGKSSGSQGQGGGKPMEDSKAAGGSGPGEVEQRRIGTAKDWGDLPPKQRQEALQQIGKGLPSHYRQVIEEYFRKLAKDGNN